MLKSIIPLASEITLTSFFVDNQDLVHLSEKPEEIGRRLEIKRFRDYEIVADPKKAFQSVLKAKEKTIIVTGSLYLLGEIYRIIK
jgi:folylpolyglutamate synthase/dihydropteroate synthase